MPAEHETTVNIACDNPACPGNSLDPHDRVGWLFISSEVYGSPVQQSVFCSTGCVSAGASADSELFTGPPPPEIPELEPVAAAADEEAAKTTRSRKR